MTQDKQYQGLLQTILIALLTLAVLLSLYIFRSYDDNRLTSWAWVFAEFSAVKFFIMLTACMLISYPLARIPLTERASVFLLIGLAFFVSTIFWRQPEVIVDASRYFMQAKHVELYGPGYFIMQWGRAIPAWTDMPLVPFLYGVIFWIFGETRVGIQVFTSLLFSATLALTYLIGKTLWDRQTAFNAAALLLAIPYLYTQVPLLMVDIAAMFFLTLAIYAVIKAIEEKNIVLCLLASLAITLALLSKYSNGLMLSVIPVIFVAFHHQGWRVLIRVGGLVAVGVFVLMGIFLWANFDIVIEQLQLLQGYQLPALNKWKESLVSTFLFQIHPVISIAAVYSLYRAVKYREIKYIMAGWLLLLVLLLGIGRIRYLIVILPMFTLMSAYGLSFLKSPEVRKYVMTSSILSAVLIALLSYLPFLERTSLVNIKQAGEYLDAMVDIDSVDVYVQNQSRSSVNPSVIVPILDLFTEKELVFHRSGNTFNPPGNFDRLPLRWTWEVDSTLYLPDKPDRKSDNRILVVIQSGVKQPLPEHIIAKIKDHHLRKEFNVLDRAFKFQATVKIFHRSNRKIHLEAS